ncbi:MAG: hypothetical protein ABIH25_01890 [Candidatus Woesearchaeota archaeon]
MRKGQLMGQPFVYIFLLIVAAIILFFGVKAIINVINTGQEVEYQRFVSDIEEVESKVYHDSFGSIMSLENINIPNSISEICIIDRNSEIDLSLVNNFNLREFINLSYSGFQDENVFFADEKLRSKEFERIYIEGLNPLCDNLIDNKIDIRFTNKGELVLAEHI